MFLVNVKEALGYTHEQTLNSSYALITGMLQEYAYMCNERNKSCMEKRTMKKNSNGWNSWISRPVKPDATRSTAMQRIKYNNKKLSNEF